MKASIPVITALMACVITTSAIPMAEESKALKDQVRQKRGGWGYETAFVPSAPITTTVLGPSKTIITSPQVVHTAVAPSTTYVVPQRVATVATSAIAVPASHTESYVYHSAPDHSYYIHQRHPSSYYYYPQQTHYYYSQPSYYTTGVASVPVQIYG